MPQTTQLPKSQDPGGVSAPPPKQLQSLPLTVSSRAQPLPGRGRLRVSLRTKGLLNKTVKSQSSPKLFKSLETELVSRVQNLTSAAPLFGSDLHTQGSGMKKILVQRD